MRIVRHKQKIHVKACLKPFPQQLCKHSGTDNYKICNYYIEQELTLCQNVQEYCIYLFKQLLFSLSCHTIILS